MKDSDLSYFTSVISAKNKGRTKKKNPHENPVIRRPIYTNITFGLSSIKSQPAKFTKALNCRERFLPNKSINLYENNGPRDAPTGRIEAIQEPSSSDMGISDPSRSNFGKVGEVHAKLLPIHE